MALAATLRDRQYQLQCQLLTPQFIHNSFPFLQLLSFLFCFYCTWLRAKLPHKSKKNECIHIIEIWLIVSELSTSNHFIHWTNINYWTYLDISFVLKDYPFKNDFNSTQLSNINSMLINCFNQFNCWINQIFHVTEISLKT